MFHHSKYWGTWSRVLLQQGVWYVEVNLTPINPTLSGSWEAQVRPIIIRRHCTLLSAEDLHQRLAAAVVARMVQKVGERLTTRLLTEDFLSQIHLPTLERTMRGGGLTLEECRRYVKRS